MLHQEAVNFLNEHEIPLAEIMKLPKDKFEPFKAIYSEHIGSPILSHIKAHLDYYKLDANIFKHVYLGIMAIALKHPISNEGNLSKLDNASSRIKMQVVNEELDVKPLKAIARVRIPMVEEKNEDEDDEDRESHRGSEKPPAEGAEGEEAEEKKS